jgi:hypothetical protein
MAQMIVNILLVIVAIVVVVTVGMFALTVLGTLIGLLVLALKLAFVGGLIYLGWVVVRKLFRAA